MRTDSRNARVRAIALRALPVPTLILVWGLFAKAGPIPPTLFPSPFVTLLALREMMVSGELLGDVLATVGRALAGFAVGSALGIVAGTLTARIGALNLALGQIIQLFRPIPPIAIVPLIVVWLGLGEMSKLVVVAWGVFFPVWVSTHVGVAGVDQNLVWVARSLGARRERLLFRVVLPAAARHVVAGMRVALALSLICVVVAEMIGASAGLGFRLNTSYLVFRVDRMFVDLATLGAVGLLLDVAFVAAVSRLLPWYAHDAAGAR
jgi:NitT/TauT family transport system permease protein